LDIPKKGPVSPNIEKELKERIKSIGFIDYFVVSKNGFINFFLKDEFVLRSLKEIYSKNFLNYINYGADKKINVEFVSANPTGPLHIAHIRGAVFGDVLCSLYTKTGFHVTREYYVNDAGSQIDKLSNSLLKRYLQLFDKKIELEEDEYPGEYLIDIAKKINSTNSLKKLKDQAIVFDDKNMLNWLINSDACVAIVPYSLCSKYLKIDPRLSLVFPSQGVPLMWHFILSRSKLKNQILIKWIKSLENKSMVDKLVSEGWYLPFNSDYLQNKYKSEIYPIAGPLKNVGIIVGLSLL